MLHRSTVFGLLVGVIATLLVSSVAGCGVTSSGTQRVASPSPTFASAATPEPTQTPAPFGQPCAALFGPPAQVPVVATAGDIQFGAMHLLAIDPPRQLSDNLTLKPYAVDGGSPGYLDALTTVNVHMYSLSLCNASKTNAHVISGVTVKLDAFTGDGNTINTSHYCIELYTRQGMANHTGCGGGFAGGDLDLQASFAANGTVGAIVPAVKQPSGQTPSAATLNPGYGAYITIDITPPPTPGTVRYRIGFAFDGAAPSYSAPASPPVLNSTTTRAWDGNACLSDAMQQQIPPATNPPTFYICPQP